MAVFAYAQASVQDGRYDRYLGGKGKVGEMKMCVLNGHAEGPSAEFCERQWCRGSICGQIMGNTFIPCEWPEGEEESHLIILKPEEEKEKGGLSRKRVIASSDTSLTCGMSNSLSHWAGAGQPLSINIGFRRC